MVSREVNSPAKPALASGAALIARVIGIIGMDSEDTEAGCSAVTSDGIGVPVPIGSPVSTAESGSVSEIVGTESGIVTLGTGVPETTPSGAGDSVGTGVPTDSSGVADSLATASAVGSVISGVDDDTADPEGDSMVGEGCSVLINFTIAVIVIFCCEGASTPEGVASTEGVIGPSAYAGLEAKS